MGQAKRLCNVQTRRLICVDPLLDSTRLAPMTEEGTKRPSEAASGSSPKKARSMEEFDMRKRFKEGQKNVTPPVADPTRGFYESLLKENPESKIAIKYCIEQGVLSKEEHEPILKKYYKLRDKGA